MSGHSHWATIRRKKDAKDAKKGQVFSKLAKGISVAARGGGDPNVNYKLKMMVDAARNQGMPKDSIERAIRKGSGADQADALEEVVYEGLGPENVQVIVDAVTDKRNRTTAEMRKLFEKKGGKLGSPNSVAWNFEQKGHLAVGTGAIGEEELFELVVDAGAENMEKAGDAYDIYCQAEDLDRIRGALAARGLEPSVCEIVRVARTTVKIEDAATAGKVLGFVGDLEEHDDVQTVSANFDIPDAIMAELG